MEAKVLLKRAGKGNRAMNEQIGGLREEGLK